MASGPPHPIDWRSDAFRSQIKQRVNETAKKAGLNAFRNLDIVEEKIFQQVKSREEYISLITKVLNRAQEKAIEMASGPPNPIDWRSDAFRSQIKQRVNETAKKAGLNAFRNLDIIEGKIFQQVKSREEYISLITKVLNRAQGKAMESGSQQQQQQMRSNAAPVGINQNQQVPQQKPSQVFMNSQETAGNMQNMQQHGNNAFSGMQNNQSQGNIFPPGGVAMRAQMPGNTPMPRVLPGSAPSPQSAIGNFQRQPQWSQQSPSNNQYQANQFVQPKPPLPTPNNQPVLTMPDSTGTPHPSAIPSLSPAHPSPQVPITSPSLCTPGNVLTAPSPGSLTIPSPASVSQPQVEDDKEYMEKLKQLQKYIEPLSRMINKFNEDEDKEYNKDLSKMKNLRDTLINPTKRLQISTLEKCESVLQNWLDNKSVQKTTFPPQQPNQHMCQPILNVIASATKSPLLNHTLKRTFGPAMRTICGDYTTPDFLPSKKQCLQKAVRDLEKRNSEESVPDSIQGEIARLDGKYNVKLDRSHANDDGDIRLICQLDDPRLPSVPPLRLSVPKSYPKESPEWIQTPLFSVSSNDLTSENLAHGLNRGTLKAEGFHSELQPILKTRLTKLTDSSCTISSIIGAWETSVREACAVNA